MSSLKSLCSVALTAGAALALVAGGLALDVSPASAAGGVLGLTLTTLSGTPVTSNDGNTYTVEFDNPNESVTPPTGVVTVSDGVGGQCETPIDDWTLVGSDGGGGFDFTNSCHIEAPEEAGSIVTATYSGSDFGTLPSSNSLIIVAIPATLQLSGSDDASATGNDYTVTLSAENGAPPVGAVTIADGIGGECQSNSWTNEGPDGDVWDYSMSCDIGTALSGGDTITATYSGDDYTTTASNQLTIAQSGATLSLIGAPTASATGNEMIATMTTGVEIAPIGTVTITDSVGGECQTSSWSDPSSIGVDNWSYTATCDIATAEFRTDTISATYAGADYDASLSNVLTVAAASSTLTLSGTPVTAVGNSYTATLDASGGLPPDGEVSVIDSVGGSCTTTVKTDVGPDGHGGENFRFTCNIPTAEHPGDSAYAVYSGSDYSPEQSNTIIVSPASVTLTLSGTPVANENGNSFVATLDAPSDLAPTGAATISDSADNSCQAGSWTEGGSDGHGGENFTATCDIENAEVAGDTVTATYVGSDYTAPISNELTVGGPASISAASISGLPVVGQQLFANAAGVSGSPTPTATYQWYDGSTEIPGATSVIYAVQTSDVGQSISVTITETNGVGTAASATSNSLSVEDPATITSASITGTAQIGDTLTAVAAGVTGAPAPTATYRWFDGSTEIPDAFSSTYTVQSSDAGDSISVTITETNGVEAPAFATSPGTTDVAAAPSISGASISGIAEVEDTLTAVASGVSGTPAPTATFQWYDGSAEIAGATSSTYTVQSSDAGDSISVTITETNGVGTAASATSTGTAQVTAAPLIASAWISGTAVVGDTLTAAAAGVTGTPAPTATYQWYDGSTEIAGATSSTYTVQSSDAGDSISVTIAETNGVGTSAMATSSGTADVGAAPSIASASISGVPDVGISLVAVATGVSGTPSATATYQWYDGSTAIPGATSVTYRVQSSDLGNSISVTITESNGVGSAASATSSSLTVGESATIAAASITGTAVVGDTLTAVASGVTGTPAPTATYQWYDGSTPIGGATSSTYVVQSSDLGDSIVVTITETNGGASPSATSIGTANVTAAPSIASATITGTAAVGDTLTAVASGVDGVPSPAATYQWFEGSTPIGGATSSTYVVQSSDLGDSIVVTITETNGVGTAASATSTGSANVTAEPSITSALISGTPEVGDTLTAVASGVSGTPSPTATYQWYEGSTEISGATLSTYTVPSADLGVSISATITETNGVGIAASATSNSVTVVAPSAIASVYITGTPEVGDTLTAFASGVAGTPSPSATYQWFDDSTPLTGATSSTYIVEGPDVGDSISVTITEANGVGTAASATSTGTANVTAEPSITSASIGGTADIGFTLTAVASGVTGAPSPTATYQWYDGSTEITGATSSTYVVQSADFGDSISVTITETNGVGVSAMATSTGTGDVITAPVSSSSGGATPPTTPPTTPPSIPPTPPVTTTHTSSPAPASLGFSPGVATLSVNERTALDATAKKLKSGAHVTITGYAKGSAAMARHRADVVAAYLKARSHVTVTIRVSTASSNKVTVVTTKD